MTKKNKITSADNFLKSLNNDPEAIIEWCESEIKEYKKLIKLIKYNSKEII